MRVEAIIDLENFRYNLDNICKKVPKEKVMAIVKANAYGHGYRQIVLESIKYGINFFGVATEDEALELRSLSDDINILILSPVSVDNIENLTKNNIHLTISSFEDIEYIIENDIKGNYHLAFDTGMGRIGFNEDNIEKAIKLLKPIGIFSHFSVADSNEEYTRMQEAKFRKIVSKYDIKYKHISNSFASDKYDLDYDLYRPGIILYGGEMIDKYKPVMSLKARVNHVKKLDYDSNIGYSNTYTAKKGDVIATISIGYADGVFRVLSNKGQVYLNGKRYPVIGNICMDQLMILADENVKVGDFVEIFGNNIPVSEVAKLAGTISYELLCAVSNRVPRIYINKGEK